MNNQVDRLYEQLLVLRCQTGDTAAFKELVERYQRRLRYYVRRMLPDHDLADDVQQDVWFDVFRSIRKMNDATAFQAWLYRIARVRVYGRWRKHRVEQSIADLHQIVDDSSADEFSFADAERVHSALGQLSLEHREALVLRFVEGMSYEDIAAVVECSPGTIKSRLHYAKSALRRLIEIQDSHDKF